LNQAAMQALAVKGIVTCAKCSGCPNNTKKTAAIEKIGDNSTFILTLVFDLFSYFKNNPFQTW